MNLEDRILSIIIHDPSMQKKAIKDIKQAILRIADKIKQEEKENEHKRYR